MFFRVEKSLDEVELCHPLGDLLRRRALAAYQAAVGVIGIPEPAVGRNEHREQRRVASAIADELVVIDLARHPAVWVVAAA